MRLNLGILTVLQSPRVFKYGDQLTRVTYLHSSFYMDRISQKGTGECCISLKGVTTTV